MRTPAVLRTYYEGSYVKTGTPPRHRHNGAKEHKLNIAQFYRLVIYLNMWYTKY